jgi:hypothetical protein
MLGLLSPAPLALVGNSYSPELTQPKYTQVYVLLLQNMGTVLRKYNQKKKKITTGHFLSMIIMIVNYLH